MNTQWRQRMSVKNGGLLRIIRIFSIIISLSHGTAAFAYDPVDCFDDIAKVDSGINNGLATRLCSGAWTPEPVHCYQNVPNIDADIPRGIAIDLCAGTVDAGKTLDCYEKASTELKLNRGLATTLCGAKKPEQ